MAKALARAGSFEALVPHLREGRILARCSEIHRPGIGQASGPRDIRPDWWTNARVDPATGRVMLTTPGSRIISPGETPPPPRRHEVFALGIEVERGSVDALWPAKPKAQGRKRGPKQSAIWAPLLAHLDRLVSSGKISNPAEEAFPEAKRWSEENKHSLSDSALNNGLKRNRPYWFKR
jgi:hypothetical protein